MQLVLFNEDGIKLLDIEGTLEEYYKYIGCSCIDIVTRKVGDTYFDIICDDEGLLKDSPHISAVDTKGNPMLVGNLIFTHTDEEGETIGVTDNDVATIMDEVRLAIAPDDRLLGIVIRMDY